VSGLLSRGWCRWGCRRERRGWGGGGRLGRSKRRAVGEGVGRRGRGGRGCSGGWVSVVVLGMAARRGAAVGIADAYRRTFRDTECGSLTASWDGYRWWLMMGDHGDAMAGPSLGVGRRVCPAWNRGRLGARTRTGARADRTSIGSAPEIRFIPFETQMDNTTTTLIV
jgi:hypothetical protein